MVQCELTAGVGGQRAREIYVVIVTCMNHAHG